MHMAIVEWISTVIQLGVLGVSLLAIGVLIWTWLSSSGTGDRSDDGYEPPVHHDPMDDLGDDF